MRASYSLFRTAVQSAGGLAKSCKASYYVDSSSQDGSSPRSLAEDGSLHPYQSYAEVWVASDSSAPRSSEASGKPLWPAHNVEELSIQLFEVEN
jgi:hypothetical protein